MIVDIDRQTLAAIHNPDLRAYAARYLDLQDDFMAHVREAGMEIDANDYAAETAERLERLRQKGARFRNDGKSIVAHTLSPACVACQRGIGSATFFISLRCHRTCFYCFNPNQELYDHFTVQQRNLPQELEQLAQSGQSIQHLALTGGEPLLHKQETVEFFRCASEKFPEAYTRLYTTGDQLTPGLARELGEAGLDEIRFSIRMHDLEQGHRHTFERIALAKNHIPVVMVEMPILPGTLEVMKEVLVELDRLGVASINLLEFCYPFNQTQVFNQKGYKIKARPFRVFYNYWYAGGLPIARSELECLDLVAFALEAGLKMGVHYCSLENKHTGQIYQQNAGPLPSERHYFSPTDYFLKTAKVFGADIRKARKALRHHPDHLYRLDTDHNCLELHVSQIEALQRLNVEVGLSYNVMEAREDGHYLRELKVALVRPESFDPEQDM
jgi:pyruvate formate-lyase activating enzyme-like uncharacterized protein